MTSDAAVDGAPIAGYYQSLPNAGALYGTFSWKLLPFWTWEERIEGWGQLCEAGTAVPMIRNYMHNRGMEASANFVSWRCEILNPPAVGHVDLSGTP